MLSKNKTKFINSIKKKKYRELHQCFFAEGEKLVDELLNSDFQITDILSTKDWIEKNANRLKSEVEITEISETELKKISSLSTPNKVFAIAAQPELSYNQNEIQNELSLILDTINDPGNLGTIIRIADWFGIKNIFCSNDSVDVYNPKVVQASMGAIFRVKIHYVDLTEFLPKFKQSENFKIFGTLLDGNNIYNEQLSKNGFIIMGSESHGISEYLRTFINTKLFIPNFPENIKTSESLNISTATAIVCSEFRRRF
ncbi:MAG: RNA methyltransferase [Bacteroidales bacterium]|nr:RNA methyltransferase [Bacteroidales bacterium]